MRVVVANKFWYVRGGLERVLFDEIEMLEGAGVSVAHFSTAHPDNLDSPWSEYFAPYLELGQASGLGRSGRALAAWRMFANRPAARSFGRLLDDFRPDIVHCHGIHRQLSPSMLFEAARRNIPVVQSLHDFHHLCPADTLMRPGDQRCLPRLCGTLDYSPAVRLRCVRGSRALSALSAAETGWQRLRRAYERTLAAFISPSRFLAQQMEAGGWTLPCHVVPNPVRLGEPPVRVGQADPPADDGTYAYVLVAGRLVAGKGIDVALRAASSAGTRIIVAGDGPARGSFERAHPEAVFVGHVSPAEVRRLARGALAVLVPSTCVENAPLAVLEAMAEGAPVVASRVGGVPEMIDDGRDGILVEPGDVDGLRAAIVSLRSDPDLRRLLAAAAYDRVAQVNSPEAHLSSLLSVYRECVGHA